jgi:hypothetical protein
MAGAVSEATSYRNGWMRRGCLIVLLLLAATCATARAVPSSSISQTAFAGLRLGLAGSAYTHALGEQPFVTTYADGRRRLAFAEAEITVVLDRAGRGTAISSTSADYALRGGVAPCGPAVKLQRLYRPVTVRAAGPFGPGATVYRIGRLWITMRTPQAIGRITLSAKEPALRSLIGEAQCGAGEGEGE